MSRRGEQHRRGVSPACHAASCLIFFFFFFFFFYCCCVSPLPTRYALPANVRRAGVLVCQVRTKQRTELGICIQVH